MTQSALVAALAVGLGAAAAQGPASPADRPLPVVPTEAEVICPKVSATTIHGWQTCRLVRYQGALYASAALPNPQGSRYWDHEGVFFRRDPNGTWREVCRLPNNPYTMCVGPDGSFWAVAPPDYEHCRVYRTRRPRDLSSFTEVHTGTCSYLGAAVSREGDFLVLYAESADSTAGKPNAVIAAFHERATDTWHRSRIETPEGRYGYEGILLKGRSALVVLNSSLTDPAHPDAAGTSYSWRHVRLARCDDLRRAVWINKGWLMPQDGTTHLQDLAAGRDGNAYLSYAHVAAPSHEALLQVRRVPHLIARIHPDLRAEVFETGANAGSTRLLVDRRGRWHMVGRSGSGNLRLWDLDGRRGFAATNERELANTQMLADYVLHTLRPERFGGESDGDTVHLVGTPGAPPSPDPFARERAEVPLWHVSFRLSERPASQGVRARRDAGMKADGTYQAPGVKDNLPAFTERLAARLTFPLSWASGRYRSFSAWRRAARAKVLSCLPPSPPPVPFDPVVVAEEDRGAYVARKVVISLTADSRVLGYLLVPKGTGPFPAVLLLHDHGARFDIGKEKVIRPFNDLPERVRSSEEWTTRYYGGRYLGDELAQRGYVCFATDMLNWSDRGGAGYEGQQALASNLFHLGTSFAGLIAQEDMRAAEFLAGRPEVDPRRVAAMGLSVGAFRTWQLAALSNHIAAGVAICWMATVKGLMIPGQNMTVGQSAFTMLHPGLFNALDYPDVASIACPKPMLLYSGERDGLFPVPSVQEAYAKMRRVWESQGVGSRLETRIWDVEHVFDAAMQESAFVWLGRHLAPSGGRKPRPEP